MIKKAAKFIVRQDDQSVFSIGPLQHGIDQLDRKLFGRIYIGTAGMLIIAPAGFYERHAGETTFLGRLQEIFLVLQVVAAFRSFLIIGEVEERLMVVGKIILPSRYSVIPSF